MRTTTSLPAAEAPAAPAAAPPARWPAWAREPLLHFLVLGALLFAADHFIAGRADDPRTIVVDAEVDRQARETFKASRGVEPGPEQMAALRQVWLDNEVLYREGLALQLDKGDPSIRDRVIFKALSMVDANVKRPPLDEKTLRDWFEKNRARYDEPPRWDFQEAVLDGDNSEAGVRAFVAALNGGLPGDARAGLRVFKGRPHANILQSYGADFAKALEEMPPGEWRALKTREGWRAMRLDAIVAGRTAQFEAVQSAVLQDWTDTVMAEQRTAAVRTLAAKYKVRYEGVAR